MPCKKHIFSSVLLLSLQLTGLSQNKLVKSTLKEAQVSFDIGDYKNALPLYKQVLVMDKKNDKAGLNATVCMFGLGYAMDSIYPMVPNLSSSSLPDSKYYLAKIYHRQKHFDDAIPLLESYNKISEGKRTFNTAETDHLINQCKNAKQFMAAPHRSIIKNMGPEINSIAADYVPVILPDESAMYFTSRREGSSDNKKDGYGNIHEDVYVSYRENGKWTPAQNIGPPINSETNDACVAISPDGQRMIVYRTSEDVVTGDLYITHTGNSNKWEPLQKMGKEINSQYIETSACFSNDTSEYYFSSNRPGGYGGKDLYRVKKLPNGKWAMPFNLGPNVNSVYDEDAPFLHPDGITLYYSSKGFNTMGEYDVFRSVLNTENNTFSKAENLGYPINSVDNDIFFVLSVDGQRGYYSSIKDETFGGNDIYQVDTRYGDNDLKVKPGIAYLNGHPDKVKITLLDMENNTVSGTYNSNPKTGKFILVMNPLKSYKAIVERDGYTTAVMTIDPLAFEKTEKDLEFKLTKISE